MDMKTFASRLLDYDNKTYSFVCTWYELHGICDAGKHNAILVYSPHKAFESLQSLHLAGSPESGDDQNNNSSSTLHNLQPVRRPTSPSTTSSSTPSSSSASSHPLPRMSTSTTSPPTVTLATHVPQQPHHVTSQNCHVTSAANRVTGDQPYGGVPQMKRELRDCSPHDVQPSSKRQCDEEYQARWRDAQTYRQPYTSLQRFERKKERKR